MSASDERKGDGSAAPVGAQSDLELLVFLREEIASFDLPRRGEATIGRDEGNTVRIDDPSVSRQHAVLRIGDSLEIEDLGGANGIFVREKAQPQNGIQTHGNQTQNVRQLVRCKASLAVGEQILLGAVSAVVRHVPQRVVPDLDASFPGTTAVVSDPAMRALYEQAGRAARASISVLILGETGVGKEVLARAIHAHSPRAAGPFMGINCAALPESLLESELFGNEKGAFTGAVAARAGLFEAAQGGTVLLDEIGELPLATQGRLLRVLEERVVTRLGSTRARSIDVRFVAATNRNLEDDSRRERFRSDLYFRLAGITLSIPPLRERPGELELLARDFAIRAGHELDRDGPLEVSDQALDLLRRHHWPGNVRELRNVIQRAAVLCVGDAIKPEHLPPSLLGSSSPRVPVTVASTSSVPPSDEPAPRTVSFQRRSAPSNEPGSSRRCIAAQATRAARRNCWASHGVR